MYATLVFDPAGESLTCRCDGIPTDTPLTYRLLRHSTLIDESHPTPVASYEWDVTTLAQSGGDFHVEVRVGDGEATLMTEWQYIPSEAQRTDYIAWLDEETPSPDLALPTLSAANRPYESIAFIRFAPSNVDQNSSLSISNVAAAVRASVFSLSPSDVSGSAALTMIDPAQMRPAGAYVLTSAQPFETLASTAWAFGSGLAFDSGTLRRGSEVVRALSPHPSAVSQRAAGPVDRHPRYTSSCCGDFLAAVWHADGSIEFHTDYVGAAAWYEYNSDRLRIVASSFLLAIWIAKACGENLSLNLATVDADFTSLTQPFQQPLLDDLELHGFSCLRPDSILVVHADGRSNRERSQLGHDVAAPERLTTTRYNELLDAAAAELVANCRAITGDPEIKAVRCDITGGLDSRLVLAGFLAGSPAAVVKLSLYTESPDHAPSSSDEEIATLIAAATGLPFSDKPETAIGPCSLRHLAETQVAAAFGIYWHRSHGHALEWDPATVFAGGAGLDNIARDYTTASWQLVTSRVQSPREVSVNLAQQIFKWRGRASLKAAPHHGLTDIAAQWDDIPGNETDKASQLFNFHRARFHGGGSIPAALGTLRVGPGPTRSLYRLRLMAGAMLDGPRVQLELIHRLNPGLAAVPYGDPDYNRAYSSLFGSSRTDLVGDLAQLRQARDRRRSGKRWIACPQCDSARSERSAELLIDITMQALHDLGKDPLLSDAMLPAYRFARQHLGTTFDLHHSYSRTLINKVLHLHAMWRLTQGDSGALPSPDAKTLPIDENVPQPSDGLRQGDKRREAPGPRKSVFAKLARSSDPQAWGRPGVLRSNDASMHDAETELRGLFKPRIGITGSFARGNYGDELYVRVYEQWLGRWADLTLLTGLSRPAYFREIRNTQVDLMDAVVLGGGDLLCPYRPHIDADFVNPMYLRRPVHVAGIGVELNRPDINPDVVKQWRRFLRHPSVRSVSTRDSQSSEWLKRHILGRRYVASHPDLVCALSLPRASRPEGAPILGLVTRHLKHPRDYVLMAEVSRRLMADGWRVRHIIAGVGDHGQKDFENAEELKLEGKETVRTHDIDEISRALGECTLVLSMKLHATLVATMYGVPTICVNPVSKARAFMKSIDREDLVIEPKDPRLLEIVAAGVPDVPMEKVEQLRAQAIDYLKSLSQRIWQEYRDKSAVRKRLLPEMLSWE